MVRPMLWGAMVLARRAGMFIVLTSEPGAVRLTDDVLEVGGGLASPDEVATIACRRALARRGVRCEARVALEVEAHGYSYLSKLPPSELAASSAS